MTLDIAINTSPRNKFQPDTPDIPPPPRIRIRQILGHVARHYGHTPEALLGHGKAAPYPLHRWIVMHLAGVIKNPSLSFIARELRRDHTTVSHGIMKVRERMAANPAFAAEVQRLESDLRQIEADLQRAAS